MAEVVSDSRSARAPRGGTVVAVGNFDGVHVGHRAVLARTVALAGELGAEPWVYTFDPAPTAIVAPSRHQPRICTLPTRVARLHEAGAAVVVVERFDTGFAAVPAEAFAQDILVGRLGARGLVVGHDFRFGAGRRGDAAALRAWLPGVRVEELAGVVLDGAAVSSSRVRRLLLAGDVAGAARLLGRPSTLSGEVVRGDQRGRTLGFPTANLAVREELLPADGVYAGWAAAPGVSAPMVLNIGVRPTFSGLARTVEAHLLDFDGDLYGAVLVVDLRARIRGEVRFGSVEALVARIREDVAVARASLA